MGGNFYNSNGEALIEDGAAIAATQAEMETATATGDAAFVTPGRTQYHPGVAKARWNGFTNGTFATHESYNVVATDNGTGDHTFTFGTDFSSVNYGFAGSGGHTSNTPLGIIVQAYDTDLVARAAGVLRVWVTYGTTLVDTDELDLIFFGDQ